MEFRIWHGLNTGYYADIVGCKEDNNGIKKVIFFKKQHNRKNFLNTIDLTQEIAFFMLNDQTEKLIKFLPKEEIDYIQDRENTQCF